MAKQVKCPRCETVQPLAHYCVECGMDFKEHMRKLKGQSAAAPQTTHEDTATPAPEEASRTAPAATQKIVTCPECGQRQRLSTNCSNCGLNFKEYARTLKAQKSAPPQPSPQPLPPEPQMRDEPNQPDEQQSQAGEHPRSGQETRPEHPAKAGNAPHQQRVAGTRTATDDKKEAHSSDSDDIWVANESASPANEKPHPKVRHAAKEKPPARTSAKKTGGQTERPQGQHRANIDGGLRDIGSLFTDAWAIYKERFTPLFLLNLLTIPFLLGPPLALGLLGMIAGIFGSEMLVVGAGIGAILGFIVGMVLMFVPIAGLIAAINDSALGVKDALAVGFSKLWSFLWVIGLVGFIVPGGYMLLIVPGLVFTVWFLLAQFVVMMEPERGMGALLKSKAYIRGRWWPIMGRLLLIMLLSGVAGMVPFGSLLINPYMLAMLYLIYMDLREEKGQDVAYSHGTWDKLKWPLLALAIYALSIVTIIVIGASSVGQNAIKGISGLEGMIQEEQQHYNNIPPPEIITDRESYAPGEIITVQYSGMPGNQSDWISIALATDPDSANMDGYWYYTEGRTRGTITFDSLPEGVYEIRAYFDWDGGGGYNVKTRKRVIITSGTQTDIPAQKEGLQ